MRSTLLVITVHLLALVPLLRHQKPVKPKPSHVRVHTVQLERPKPQPLPQAPKPASQPKPIVEKKPDPKPISKPVAQKQPTPKPKPAKKEQSELLALMEESLSGLEKASPKTTNISAPTKIGALKSESLPEASYQDALVDYLQTLLHFPEDGDVRVKLTITREGKITTCAILKASSGRNEDYVCQALSTVVLPPFGNNFKGESAHTFSIWLTSK